MFFIKKYKKELYELKIKTYSLEEELYKLKKDLSDLKLSVKYKHSEHIMYEGFRYKKVNRKARHGDVVVVKSMINESSFVKLNKPYKVYCNYKGVPFIERDYLAGVYHEGFGRTQNTVDVYELVHNG